MEQNQITGAIITAAMKVHTLTGPGLLESIYHTCLKHEIEKAGLKVQSEVVLPVHYDGLVLESGYKVFWLSFPISPASSVPLRFNGLTLSTEFDPRLMRNDACPVAHSEQFLDGFAAVIAIVEGAGIYIHADKAVGHLRVKVAGELHGVGESFLAMIKRVLNAFTQCLVDAGNQLRSQVPADGVAAQRQG
jgi:hypothetical protein